MTDIYVPLFSAKSKTIIATFNNVKLYRYHYQIENEVFDEVIACVKSINEDEKNIIRKNKIVSFGINKLSKENLTEIK